MRKIILGIDPGYDRCGFAVIDASEGINKEKIIFSDCINTDRNKVFVERLFDVSNTIEDVIKTYKPDIFAIETLFFNTNQKTASKVYETRGALMYLAKKHNLEIFEYTPLQIKVAITNSGRATKREIYEMLPRLIKISKKIKYDDEFDAIACALTCAVTVK